jgi:hypothetical protein
MKNVMEEVYILIQITKAEARGEKELIIDIFEWETVKYISDLGYLIEESWLEKNLYIIRV